MRTNNKKAIESMKNLIKENLSLNDFQRYVSEFKREYDFNIYQYGNLDVYDYDLYLRLKKIGIDTKAVTEFEKVLNGGCTYTHRENIRNTYINLVRNAAFSLCDDIRAKKVNESDFIQ